MKKQKKTPGQGIPIRLAEKDGKVDPNLIQIFRVGEYHHEYYGPFQLSPEVFEMMIANWKKNVYGIDLMIDYNHYTEEAAAWVKDLFTEDDGNELWARVEWTPTGKERIENKEYRYLSGDFSYNHTDPESDLEFGPILYGAALTNRPFIKGMSPTTKLKEPTGGKMTLQELQAKNTQLAEQVEANKKEHEGVVLKLKEEKSAVEAQVLKLGEEIKTLKEASEKSAKESEFALLLSEGKAVPAQKDAFLKGDMAAFAKAAGTVKLKEQGKEGEDNEDLEVEGNEKQDKLLKLAEEKFAAGGFKSLGDAIAMVLKEKPELK